MSQKYWVQLTLDKTRKTKRWETGKLVVDTENNTLTLFDEPENQPSLAYARLSYQNLTPGTRFDVGNYLIEMDHPCGFQNHNNNHNNQNGYNSNCNGSNNNNNNNNNNNYNGNSNSNNRNENSVESRKVSNGFKPPKRIGNFKNHRLRSNCNKINNNYRMNNNYSTKENCDNNNNFSNYNNSNNNYNDNRNNNYNNFSNANAESLDNEMDFSAIAKHLPFPADAPKRRKIMSGSVPAVPAVPGSDNRMKNKMNNRNDLNEKFGTEIESDRKEEEKCDTKTVCDKNENLNQIKLKNTIFDFVEISKSNTNSLIEKIVKNESIDKDLKSKYDTLALLGYNKNPIKIETRKTDNNNKCENSLLSDFDSFYQSNGNNSVNVDQQIAHFFKEKEKKPSHNSNDNSNEINESKSVENASKFDHEFGNEIELIDESAIANLTQNGHKRKLHQNQSANCNPNVNPNGNDIIEIDSDDEILAPPPAKKQKT